MQGGGTHRSERKQVLKPLQLPKKFRVLQEGGVQILKGFSNDIEECGHT